MSQQAWSREEFAKALHSLGHRYHIHHPFQMAMAAGQLSKKAIQGWVINRFYYQLNIPRKDAYLMARCPDQKVRRRWIQRIIDHDGREGDEGGIECWIRMGEACKLQREEIVSLKHVLPGVRFAVDAYWNFVRDHDWHEGICSSLTELFAPTAHRERLATWPKYYPWIDPTGLEYFSNRLKEAHRDVEHGLEVTLDYFITREQQNRALEILQFKLDVLWAILDAMHLAYVLDMPPYFNEAQVHESTVSG